MVHIGNIPHIIEYGITHKSSINSNPNYIPIGDSTLISTRNSHPIITGKVIGDFIPFYFGFRTPMLYVIQKGFNGVSAVDPSKIVYVVTSIDSIIKSGVPFIYTDGHATDSFSSVYSQSEITDLEKQLDFKAIRAKYWRDENDLDLKRRKEAELLLEDDLLYSYINGFVVLNDNCKKVLTKLGIPAIMILIKKSYYF
ncbi:type II toxin-antitoxin system toxin DNA ADP-ribosyl transferase DarT [Portibacter marinus]|uniref:type II toxin-antitoxin system toxin DNA ADP-ribosyl transferase DarT n=1 Tax=Portibacter marinus TaxID=2898660 RepID=UPI001F2E7FCB|nr:DUF4433 domain-containing protein [Portibacter marinus]